MVELGHAGLGHPVEVAGVAVGQHLQAVGGLHRRLDGLLQPPQRQVQPGHLRQGHRAVVAHVAAVLHAVGQSAQGHQLRLLRLQRALDVAQVLACAGRPAECPDVAQHPFRTAWRRTAQRLRRLVQPDQGLRRPPLFQLQHTQVLLRQRQFQQPVRLVGPGRSHPRQPLGQVHVALHRRFGLRQVATAAGDEADPVLALRMVEQALAVARRACQPLGRAARGFGEPLFRRGQLAAALGDLADQVQRARTTAQRLGVQVGRVLCRVVGQRAFTHRIQRVQAAHRLQPLAQVAQHELQQALGLRALGLRLVRLLQGHARTGQHSTHRHPATATPTRCRRTKRLLR
jgi:hypothetical protein